MQTRTVNVATAQVPVTGVVPASVTVLRVDGRPVAVQVLQALPLLPGTGGSQADVALAAALDEGAIVLGKLIGRGHYDGWDGWVAPVAVLLWWRGALWRAVVASTVPPLVPCADDPSVVERGAPLAGLDPATWTHLPDAVRAAVAAAPWLTLGA